MTDPYEPTPFQVPDRPVSYPGQPGYPPYPPYPAPLNTYAILSLVFAVAVFAPLGIYFGNKAKREIAERGERGIELAKAGIVCGWIFTVFQAAVLVVWCGFAGLILGAGHSG